MRQLPNAQAPDSIPLLLLQATTSGGPGLLSPTRYVQRLNTQGGQALPQTCTQEGQENHVRLPGIARRIQTERQINQRLPSIRRVDLDVHTPETSYSILQAASGRSPAQPRPSASLALCRLPATMVAR
ncbi:DUF3455 domain-containing protein [Cupriavidus pauculus]|uniref:DUF3455 domain-containing protein n=1 Tax=Cupriavidus pauculus TaxID=82633 RepID=UPI002285B009|nr:DUF3455 domain-containing protein [Cupriavidus pauculus]